MTQFWKAKEFTIYSTGNQTVLLEEHPDSTERKKDSLNKRKKLAKLKMWFMRGVRINIRHT